MHINTIWQIEKNGSLAIAKSARSGPQNPGNASFAGKILWSQIAKIAEPTPARSTDTTGNFRWSGRDTTRSAAQDQAKTGAFHHERAATDLGADQPSLGTHRQMPPRHLSTDRYRSAQGREVRPQHARRV